MKERDVPQDDNRTYGGRRRLVYAVDDDGHYTAVRSTGWKPEEFATLMAVEDLDRRAEEARGRALAGEASPLEYHMYRSKLDEQGLAQVTGLARWRVRRHFRPEIFDRLSAKALRRYADAMGLSIAELKRSGTDDGR